MLGPAAARGSRGVARWPFRARVSAQPHLCPFRLHLRHFQRLAEEIRALPSLEPSLDQDLLDPDPILVKNVTNWRMRIQKEQEKEVSKRVSKRVSEKMIGKVNEMSTNVKVQEADMKEIQNGKLMENGEYNETRFMGNYSIEEKDKTTDKTKDTDKTTDTDTKDTDKNTDTLKDTIFTNQKAFHDFIENDSIRRDSRKLSSLVCDIFFAYHDNNTQQMSGLVDIYMTSGTSDSRAFSYIFAHYCQNYHPWHAVALFKEALAQKQVLGPEVVENALSSLVAHDAVFETVAAVVDAWNKSGRSFSAAALAIALRRYHELGTDREVAGLMSLVRSCGYEHHPLIAGEELRHQIDLLELDVHNYGASMARVRAAAAEAGLLKEFYTNFVAFFADSRSLNDMEHTLRLMANDGLALRDNPQMLPYIVRFVARHTHRFGPLLELVRRRRAGFSEKLVHTMFCAFVRMHPFGASAFAEQFRTWLAESPLAPESRNRLLRHCRVRTVASQMVPCNLEDDPIRLKPGKYRNGWKCMPFQKDADGRVVHDREQMQFRMSLGFSALVERGVSPDPRVLIETYRRATKSDKAALVALFRRLRMWPALKHKLQLVDMQEKHSRKKLLHYMGNPEAKSLTNNDRLKLARMLMNKNLHAHAASEALQVDEAFLENHSKQFRFQLLLRIYDKANDYPAFIRLVEEWDMGPVSVTPYLAKQCEMILQRLSKKRKSLIQKMILVGGDDTTKKRLGLLDKSIDRMGDLVGNVNFRLKEEEEIYKRDLVEFREFLGGFWRRITNE